MLLIKSRLVHNPIAGNLAVKPRDVSLRIKINPRTSSSKLAGDSDITVGTFCYRYTGSCACWLYPNSGIPRRRTIRFINVGDSYGCCRCRCFLFCRSYVRIAITIHRSFGKDRLRCGSNEGATDQQHKSKNDTDC